MYVLQLDVTFLVSKLKKNNAKYRQIDFFKFYIQTGSMQQQWNVCHHKMDESSSILFELSC